MATYAARGKESFSGDLDGYLKRNRQCGVLILTNQKVLGYSFCQVFDYFGMHHDSLFEAVLHLSPSLIKLMQSLSSSSQVSEHPRSGELMV